MVVNSCCSDRRAAELRSRTRGGLAELRWESAEVWRKVVQTLGGPAMFLQDLVLLQSAKSLRTHKVFQDCIELAQGMYGVQDVHESGNYTCRETGNAIRIERRRKSLPAASIVALQAAEAAGGGEGSGGGTAEKESALDTDDRFFDVLKGFVEENLTDAENMAEGAFQVMLTYKELAVYFGDLNSVYPPPKSDKDPRKDLCEIFYNFAEELRRVSEHGGVAHLREVITRSAEAALELAAPPLSARSDKSAFSSEASSPREWSPNRPPQRPQQKQQQPQRQQQKQQQTRNGSKSPEPGGDWAGACSDRGSPEKGGSSSPSRPPRSARGSVSFKAAEEAVTPILEGRKFELLHTPQSALKSPERRKEGHVPTFADREQEYLEETRRASLEGLDAALLPTFSLAAAAATSGQA